MFRLGPHECVGRLCRRPLQESCDRRVCIESKAGKVKVQPRGEPSDTRNGQRPTTSARMRACILARQFLVGGELRTATCNQDHVQTEAARIRFDTRFGTGRQTQIWDRRR